ncbi:carbohydrate ABC transporter substrate-binding protein (CUT1 family) [Kribbella amoyensis]|uniref:Carbohydrate ABC transporter substrate-binding protein (CUT1 family) n=1 Tax=Kribbella amoyensis TaxID=996641 RepID=A0A561BJK5_9ACTN|nr:sugar ABC transporter substrate-binding protein [Kribbella amoyensis]TWD79037.1 carbohydrate ABC transporter substrate-binding protein (CUT1 family) [Kribbella amoyensis]
MSSHLSRRTLLLGAAGLAGVTACGSSGDDDAGSGGSVELVYRLWDEQQEVGYKKVFAAFTEENPGITVRMEVLPWDQYWSKLTTELASGKAPDVFWMTVESFPDLAGKGVLAPLDDLIADTKIDLGKYHPNVVESYKFEDKQLGMPKDLGVVGLLYNKTLVAKAGVTMPKELTWAPDGSGNFLEIARKLTVDKAGVRAGQSGFDPASVKQWGFCSWNHSQTQWLNWIPSNGGKAMDKPYGTFEFAGEQSVQALQWARDLIYKWNVSPNGTRTNPPTGQATEMFYRGEVAMFPANNALLPFALPEVKFPIGVAAMPAGPAGPTVVINGLAEVMFAKTKHPDEAGKLVAFLGSEKAQKLMGDAGYIIPALTGAGAGYTAYWKQKGVDVQPFLDSAAGSTVNMPTAEGWTAKVAEINKAVNDLYLDKTDVAGIAATMDKIGNEK